MSLLINHFYRFGEFSLDTDQGILLRADKPLALAPKVYDTLAILVENAGRIVTKEELMDRIWPNTFVEEANLTYSIQQLRKTLSDDARHPLYIETVPRRGYRFIASVEEVLLDSGTVNDHISRRLEISPLRFPDAGNGINLPVESQKSEPAVESASEDRSATPEQHLQATPEAPSVSTDASKKRAAMVAIILIVLAGAGLAVWQFSRRSNHTSGDHQSSTRSPLKLEKLTETGQSRRVAISPDGKFIAYTRGLEKNPSLWLRQLATNTNVEIVPATDATPINGLAFTNSGEYLYFVKGEPTALYRVSILGGAPTKIVDHLEGNFAVSADDRQIAYIRRVINPDGQREIALHIANADGTGERTLLTTAHPDTLNVPLITPDSQSIICSYLSPAGGKQSTNLIEIRIVDGVKRELSSETFFQIAKMAWLPDKSGIIMSARKKHEDDNQLWRVSYPGAEISQLTEGLLSYSDLSIASGVDKAVATQATHFSNIWVGPSREPEKLKNITQGTNNFCWAPNGQLIYSSKASGNVDLWVMQPDGSRQKQLTVNPTIDGTPAVTPDSRYIVFVSNRTDAYELWRMNMDGSNQIQLTNGGGNRPAISPDGKWALYNTSNWHLWKVPIDGGTPIRLTEYTAFCPAASPNGKTLACVGRDDTNRKFSILILPIEGGQPLKKIDFSGGSFRGFRILWTPDGKALIYGVENNGVTALFKQPLDGGPAEEVMNLKEDELFDYGYSPDGQSFAVTRGGWQYDIVLISNLNR